MKSNTLLTILFVIIVAIVLAGEAYVYTIDTDSRYSSDMELESTGLRYSVTSGGSEPYSVLLIDNGSFEMNDGYYMYYDTEYPITMSWTGGATAYENYTAQVIKTLNNRGVKNIILLNASELLEMMQDPLNTNSALIVLSGVLPDTVYKGNSGDEIFTWLNNGGRLYWAGGLLGAHYATSTEIKNAHSGYQNDFLGANSQNTKNTSTAKSDITTNDFRNSLSLMNNSTRYAVNTSAVTSTFIELGYTDGVYSSIVLAQKGDGMICILSGAFSNTQRHDLAQVVSSGICYQSSTIELAEGVVKRTTVNGEIEFIPTAGDCYVVYVYYGKYYPVYGELRGWDSWTP